MNRVNRWLVASVVIGLLVFGMVLWLPREPTYQNRTLTEWMLAAAEGLQGNPDDIGMEKFEEVLLALGEASVPVLLHHLRQHEPSALEERLEPWADRFPWIERRGMRRHTLSMAARVAFDVLNTNATSAIPELSRRLRADQEPWLIVPVLQSIGPASIPTLVEALDSGEVDTQVRAVFALGSFGEHAAPLRSRFNELLHDPGVPAPVRRAVASVWFESGPPQPADIEQMEKFLDDPDLCEGAALGLARAGRAGWRVLLCRLDPPGTNTTPLLAALHVGTLLERHWHGSPLTVTIGEAFNFSGVHSIYSLRLLQGSMVARDVGMSNSWIAVSLTNIISHWKDDEELAMAALAILEKVEDSKGMAVDCLTALAEESGSEVVARKATELLNTKR
jgi:hypothetical protein